MASVQGLQGIERLTEDLIRKGAATKADVNRIRSQELAAEIALSNAEETLNQAKRTLAGLLDIPSRQPTANELRGSLSDSIPKIPSTDNRVSLAMRVPPDLVAYRLGIQAAWANGELARANRYSDV